MTFLTPIMLIGALAAGIPVAIHLFFRSRYRTVPWAAMKFLLTSVEQTSRRLKFQELLLLALRMLVLVMLALAFMRPVSTVVRGAGRGDAVDAVFVFDLSYSMGAKDDDGKTRLGRARDEALKIIDELPAHSTVQIVTCAGASADKLGPHSPSNLDQARRIIEEIDIVHLNTDLHKGVALAQVVLTRGQASNKELYVFSDMQKLGFEQHAGELKDTLQDIKEKAIVHLVRCGTREIKNVTVIGITPQSGVPRPGERVGFAVLVHNTGAEALEKLKVSLAVDGDEKNGETTEIAKINPGETLAVTLNGKLNAPGLRVLTARVMTDDLEADNRLDQVILVRDQVNILVVDGNYYPGEKDAERSSSYHLMHSILPVQETQRATYKYNPRMVTAAAAAPALLNRMDLCILVNCPLQPRLGQRSGSLAPDFVQALDAFVRNGHGLIIFSGDHVQPETYNSVLGKKFGLLPLTLKAAVKAKDDAPSFLVNRNSFGGGPPAYWKFKDDDYYRMFDFVEVRQFVELDEGAIPKKPLREKKDDDPEAEEKKDTPPGKDEDVVSVIMRLNNDKPLAVSRKADSGEVVFVATSAHDEGFDPKTQNPHWTNINRLPTLLFFLDVTIGHLMHGQMQTYNVIAGQTLDWYPTDKLDHVYSLAHPDGKTIERLKPPEQKNKRVVVSKGELARAGVYRMFAHPRGADGSETLDLTAALKTSTPIAVAPDLTESADLTTLTEKQLDEQLGFQPIHIVAGAVAAGSTGADRLNREWTVWVLLAVLALVLLEVVLAWWCGRAW